MAKYLRIFDASQYISSGVAKTRVTRGIIQDHGKFRANEMPIAGVNMVLNAVEEYYNEDTTLVFAFDETPTIKRRLFKSLYPDMDYKGNRPLKERHIPVQRRMAQEVLNTIGINAISVPDYEADDVIASLVDLYKESFDHIYIHNTDSDLFYLVSDNVSIEKVGTRGKSINRQNYEYTVNKDFVIPYNTIMLNKLLSHERGDNIPPIPDYQKDKIRNALQKDYYKHFGDLFLLREWVRGVVKDDPIVVGTLDLLIPLEVSKEELILSDEFIKRDLYISFVTAFENKYYKNYSYKENEVVEDIINKYLEIYNRE